MSPLLAYSFAAFAFVVMLMLAVAPARAANWPMFRGGPGLTGVASGSLPDKPELLWSFKTGESVKSSAAIVPGRVFIGSDDGNLYALNLSDGKKVWTFKNGGAVSPLLGGGSPGVWRIDEAAFFTRWRRRRASSFGNTRPATRIPARRMCGRQIPETQLGQRAGRCRGNPRSKAPPLSGPLLQRRRGRVPEPGRIHGRAPGPGCSLGQLGLRAALPGSGNGKSNWVVETGNYINGAPAIEGGKAVFGGCDGLLHVVALADGKPEKEIEAGAYAGFRGGGRRAGLLRPVRERVHLRGFERGQEGLDVSRPRFRVLRIPGSDQDRVVFGGRDKLLHCAQREDGKALWSFPTRGKVDSSPVICGGKVVVGSDDGRL